MKITVLVENTKPLNSPLECESGLALFIEIANQKLLFDAGITAKMVANAQALHVPLDQVDLCIVSHGHFDYTGGLPAFFALNKHAKVYLKPPTKGQYFFKIGPLKKFVGVRPEIFAKFADRFIFLDKQTDIAPGVTLITDITRTHPLAWGNLKLLQKTDTGFIQDPFDHELIAVLTEAGKSAAITGCSHNGILNMIETITKVLPDVTLSIVLGGFHLMGIPILKNSMAATPDEVRTLGQQLLAFKIPKIYTMHCTGRKAYGIMKSVMGDSLEYLATGSKIEL